MKSNSHSGQNYRRIAELKKYSLINKIRKSKWYRQSVEWRDSKARKEIEKNYSGFNSRKIMPGRLIMFDYFEPKTEKELEYYDAKPCVIFFNVITVPAGKNGDMNPGGRRVLGFNIHYYPPRIRYMVMDRIMTIFKKQYIRDWENISKTQIMNFNYKELMNNIKRSGLEFGVRMYVPSLISNVIQIPPAGWEKAVFTEGMFKKKTRKLIMQYWKTRSTAKSSDVKTGQTNFQKINPKQIN